MIRLRNAWALSPALGALLGCSVAVEPVGPPPPAGGAGLGTGQVTLTWTVDGRADPSACTFYGATTLEFVIGGSTMNAPCGAFTLTVTLAPGRYEGEATLVDEGSNAVSITKPLHAIDVTSGTNLGIDLDFPRGSILPGRRAD